MKPLTLSYALSDQSFERTKSLGILNLSVYLAEHLSAALAAPDRLTVFSNRSLAPSLRLAPETETELHDDAAAGGFRRLIWDQWACLAAAERRRHEWLFLPKGFSSFLRRPRVKVAAYVHDVMHDVYRRRFPGAFPRFEAWYFARALKATLLHAKVIFTNTDFTRGEVLRVAGEAGVPLPRVVTAGIGFSPPGKPAAAGRTDSIVALLSPWPHKRADLLLKYLPEWQRRTSYAGKIHLVGNPPAGLAPPPLFTWTHYPRLEEGTYTQLLSQARAVVYFSEYEGFGMPPVEAVLAGAAPVFSDLPSTREVMGGTGCPFQNEQLNSFVQAMENALAATPETVQAWAETLQARHSWASVGQRVLNELRQ